MRFPMLPSLTSLGLVLASGALVAQAPASKPPRLLAAKSQEGARIEQAQAFLRSQASSLGLTKQDEAHLVSALTNPQGEAVVRFTQVYQGYPVFGTSLVVRVGNGLTLTSKHVEPGISLATVQPQLDSGQALAAAHRDLTPTGAYTGQPVVERIVFPAHQVGGVVPHRDATGSAWSVDPLQSVTVGAVSAPYLWAYHVTRKVTSPKGVDTNLHAIVDAVSGVILRKWSTGQDADPIASGALLPPARDFQAMSARLNLPIRVAVPAAQPAAATSKTAFAGSYTPAIGTANTLYLGQVQIPTAYDATQGGYSLLDTQRGIGATSWVSDRGLAPGNRIISEQMDYGRTVVHDDGKVTAYFYDYTLEDTPFTVMDYSTWPPTTIDYLTGSANNIWGNGQELVMNGWQVPCVFTDEGKTSAGEAMHAVTTIYDVLNNVLNRKSYDGQDSSIIVQVNQGYSMQGKASWVPDMGYIQCGIADQDGWGGPNGSISVRNGAELTSIARELGVAMHQSQVPLGPNPAMETFHLQRATGALLAQLAEAYAKRAPGDPADVIPAATVDWTFGRTRADGRPWFWMDKPSRDGISPDAYFDGIWMLGQHYVDGISFGDGPMNRAWYFMAQGSLSDASVDAYSPYLPQGMAGIGLHKTALIAYKALTEHYDDQTDYAGARAGCLAAAKDLFGEGSAEFQAVANAFAAVNVGPAFGAAEPIRVSFSKGLVDPGSPLGPFFNAQQYMFIPTGEWVRLKAQVSNATDASIDWKPEGVPGNIFTDGGATASQGTFNAEGLYRAPDKGNAMWSVQAWSHQDPRQFAQGAVWSFDVDGNGDGDVDALDFADFAMLCYLPSGYKDYLNPNGLFGPHTAIGDPEIQLVSLTFNNAFNQ